MCSAVDDPSYLSALEAAERRAGDGDVTAALRLRGYVRVDRVPCICTWPCDLHPFDWCRRSGGPDALCDRCRAAKVARSAAPEPAGLTVGLVPVPGCDSCVAAIARGPGELYAHQRVDHTYRVHL